MNTLKHAAAAARATLAQAKPAFFEKHFKAKDSEYVMVMSVGELNPEALREFMEHRGLDPTAQARLACFCDVYAFYARTSDLFVPPVQSLDRLLVAYMKAAGDRSAEEKAWARDLAAWESEEGEKEAQLVVKALYIALLHGNGLQCYAERVVGDLADKDCDTELHKEKVVMWDNHLLAFDSWDSSLPDIGGVLCRRILDLPLTEKPEWADIMTEWPEDEEDQLEEENNALEAALADLGDDF